MGSRGRGEVLAREVTTHDDEYVRRQVADLRFDFASRPGGATVRVHRRTVQADGVAIPVTVIICRAKVPA